MLVVLSQRMAYLKVNPAPVAVQTDGLVKTSLYVPDVCVADDVVAALPPAVYPPAVARSVVPGVKVVSATFTAEASATFQASVPAFMPSSSGSMAAVYLTYDAVGINYARKRSLYRVVKYNSMMLSMSCCNDESDLSHTS